MELIKYRDSGMATYTFFWKNENNQMVSPFFDSEAEANAWIGEKVDPKEIDDARAEDEAFEEIQRRQNS